MNLSLPHPSLIGRLQCDASLADTGVRIWQSWLGESVENTELDGLLSDDEVERAARFVFEHHRRRWIAARSSLRRVLGDCLNELPARLRFVLGKHGKPQLDRPWRESGIEFNLAHSGDVALIAVCPQRRVGVDVEQLRGGVAETRLAERYFSLREAAELRSLPIEEQELAFFRCWTRKEAYLKAIGCGLAGGLQSFDVTLLPGEAPELHLPAETAERQWIMTELQPLSG